MKKLVILAVGLSLALTAANAGDKSWFDPENCGMCVNMANEKGLFEHMKWETHVISNGMVSITVVDPAYAEAYQRAHKNMEKAGQEMMAGKEMDLCGFCMSYGSLMMAGAKMEAIDGEVGDVMLVTSSDEAVVAKIHAHAETTIKEYKKMMKDMHGHGHEGHGHEGHGH